MPETLKLPLLILHGDKVMLVIKATGAHGIQVAHEDDHVIKDLLYTANVT